MEEKLEAKNSDCCLDTLQFKEFNVFMILFSIISTEKAKKNFDINPKRLILKLKKLA